MGLRFALNVKQKCDVNLQSAIMRCDDAVSWLVVACAFEKPWIISQPRVATVARIAVCSIMASCGTCMNQSELKVALFL